MGIPTGGTNNPTFNFNINLDRPGTDNDVDISIDGSGGQIDIGVVKGDPNKADTITKTVILDTQNLRITGVYSFSSSAPILDPPVAEALREALSSALNISIPPGTSSDAVRELILDVQVQLLMEEMGLVESTDTPPPAKGMGGGGDPIKQLASNPWFNKSFLASFTSIMDELLNLQRSTKFLEAQVELKVRENIIAISKTQSELTKASFDAQAAEKLVEAITSFVQAGVAAISLAQAWGNAGQARSAAHKEIEADKLAVSKDLNKLENEKSNLVNNRPMVGTDPNAMTPKPLTTQEKARLAELDKQISDKTKEFNTLSSPSHLRQTINTHSQRITAESGYKNEITKNIISGISQSVQAGIISERGSIEAMKAINDGYLQALNKYAESTSKSRDEAQANFDKILDFVNKLVDSTFRAHSLGQSV